MERDGVREVNKGKGRVVRQNRKCRMGSVTAEGLEAGWRSNVIYYLYLYSEKNI